MAPGQETNEDNLGCLFDLLQNNGILSVLDEAIVVTTHNLYFHAIIRTLS